MGATQSTESGKALQSTEPAETIEPTNSTVIESKSVESTNSTEPTESFSTDELVKIINATLSGISPIEHALDTLSSEQVAQILHNRLKIMGDAFVSEEAIVSLLEEQSTQKILETIDTWRELVVKSTKFRTTFSHIQKFDHILSLKLQHVCGFGSGSMDNAAYHGPLGVVYKIKWNEDGVTQPVKHRVIQENVPTTYPNDGYEWVRKVQAGIFTCLMEPIFLEDL
jgi:hypothetical protein